MKTKNKKAAKKAAKKTIQNPFVIETDKEFEARIAEHLKISNKVKKAEVKKRERVEKAAEAYNKEIGDAVAEREHLGRCLIAYSEKNSLGKSGTTKAGIKWDVRQLKDEVKLKGKITKDFLIRQLEKIFPTALDSALNKDKLRDGIHEDEKLAKKLAKWVILKAKKSFNTKPGKAKQAQNGK